MLYFQLPLARKLTHISNYTAMSIMVLKMSNLQGCSVKKGVLRNFTKFTGKHLHQSLSLNKVAGLRPATLKKKTRAQVLFCENCEISKSTFLQNTAGRLLLYFGISIFRRFFVSKHLSLDLGGKFQRLYIKHIHLTSSIS